MITTLLAAGVAALAPAQPVQDEIPIPADTEILTTESGLKYSVLQPGNGKEFPKDGDRIKVHYTGWLEDGGKEFDSSVRRGDPAVFAVGALIDGWNEGLKLMSPGSKFKFTIPSELGYGENGAPPRIPGGSTLIFEVELFEIVERALELPAWNAEGVQTLDNGIQVMTVAAGEGKPAVDCEFGLFHFAAWDADGKFLTGTSLSGRPLMGQPKQYQTAILRDAMPLLKQGGDLVLKVPYESAKAMIDRMNLGTKGDTYWRFMAPIVVEAFEKPEFVVPPDEELTATDSGLKYKVLRKGSGLYPKGRSSTVNCHYAGWLMDGTPFDNSYDRGSPAEFPLTSVVKGWTEGIPLVDVGGKILLVIPADLGYGERGRPGIPGGATLVFVVELLSTRG